jgi:hypothetical protein
MRRHFVAWLCWCLIANTAIGEEWGTLKGKLTCNGNPPVRGPIVNRFGLNVPNQSFLVGPKGGLANMVVWLLTKDAAVHPDFLKSRKEDATLNFKGDVFEPRVLPMLVGQNLKVKNLGPDWQLVNIGFVTNPPISRLVKNTEEFRATMDVAETKPEKVFLGAEPKTVAWLLVCPNPYFAVSDAEGKFEIKNLPAGVPLEFNVWHEHANGINRIERAKVNGENANWPKGRFKVELKPQENDLGEITLDVNQFPSAL